MKSFNIQTIDKKNILIQCLDFEIQIFTIVIEGVDTRNCADILIKFAMNPIFDEIESIDYSTDCLNDRILFITFEKPIQIKNNILEVME